MFLMGFIFKVERFRGAKMNTILIVDDEHSIVNVLKEYCEYNNFIVDVAYDGMQAIQKVEKNNYDCIVLDIMMPNLNGFETIKAIKEIKNIPVIFCSAKGEEYDKLKGFDLGADDYIVKPFSPKEVIARIKAVLKRTTGFADYMNIDDLKIDLSGHKVFVLDEEIKLTTKEYEVLLLLIKNKNIVVSRDKMISEVWGWDYEKNERTIDTHIKMLRAHLKSCGKYIKTIRGLGYKFEK